MKGLGIRWVPSFLFYLPNGELIRRNSGDKDATARAMEDGIGLLLAETAKGRAPA